MGRLGYFQTNSPEFIPGLLNPIPDIQWDSELVSLLANANAALARLDAAMMQSTESKAMAFMILRVESLASCNIEKIDCTLNNVLRRELGLSTTSPSKSVDDVSRLIHTVRLAAQPLIEDSDKTISVSTISKLYKDIIQGVDKLSHPQLRQATNSIDVFVDSEQAPTYVPPLPSEMKESLLDLEIFHDEIGPQSSSTGCFSLCSI